MKRKKEAAISFLEEGSSGRWEYHECGQGSQRGLLFFDSFVSVFSRPDVRSMLPAESRQNGSNDWYNLLSTYVSTVLRQTTICITHTHEDTETQGHK